MKHTCFNKSKYNALVVNPMQFSQDVIFANFSKTWDVSRQWRSKEVWEAASVGSRVAPSLGCIFLIKYLFLYFLYNNYLFL